MSEIKTVFLFVITLEVEVLSLGNTPSAACSEARELVG